MWNKNGKKNCGFLGKINTIKITIKLLRRKRKAKHNRNLVPCEVGATFSSSMQMMEKITFPIGLFFRLGFIILMDAYRFRVSSFFFASYFVEISPDELCMKMFFFFFTQKKNEERSD